MPNHHKRTNAMGAEIAQDWQQRQVGKKSPGRHRSGRGEGCHSSHPSQGASNDRHLNRVRPVCGGSAKPRQKDGPERQSGARLAMMPIRREDIAKMGTRSLSPLRGRPLAKTRYFQGYPEPRPETHMPSASDRRFRTPSQTRKLSVRKAGESGTAPLI